MTDKQTITLQDSERQPCEVWSRCMGYLRPTSFYNIGKRGEFKQRVNFDEKVALERADTYVHP